MSQPSFVPPREPAPSGDDQQVPTPAYATMPVIPAEYQRPAPVAPGPEGPTVPEGARTGPATTTAGPTPQPIAQPVAEPVEAGGVGEAVAPPGHAVVAPATVEEPAPVALGPTGRPVVAFPEPGPRTGRDHPVVIAMCNQKGGVGKTTTTINLGASLTQFGRRVLLVDFDPQASLSIGLGVGTFGDDDTIYHLLMDPGLDAGEVIRSTSLPGMDLIPSGIDLAGAEMQLINEVAREQALTRTLAPVMDDYDVVLIDCQPSLGLLTVNALAASDGVIVPMECEYFALRGVAMLKGTIDKVKRLINPRLKIIGLLGTMFDGRTLHSREVMQTLVDGWSDDVFHTVIRRTVKFSEATVAGEPLAVYASDSPGATSYRDLAKEVLFRCPDA